MFCKKTCLIMFLLALPVLFLSAQSQETLKLKIKLDTTYNHGADVYELMQAGDYAAFGDENGEVFLIDRSGKISKTPIKHSGWVNSLSYNSTKKVLVSGGSDGILSVLDITTNTVMKTIPVCTETITQIEFISDSVLLATSDKLYMVSIEKGMIINTFSEAKQITSLIVDKDKKTALLGLEDGKISVFDINKFKSTKQLIKHNKRVTAFSISGDGKEFVSGDAGGTFIVWQLKDFKTLKSIKAHTDQISSIAFSEDNQYIVTAGWDKNIFVWNRKNYKIDLNINAHKNIVSSILFNNHKFFSASFDNTIKVWSNF